MLKEKRYGIILKENNYMVYEELKLIQIDEKNIDTEHICCAIGNDKDNVDRVNTKKQ